MSKRTKGKCKYCGKEYTFGYMNRHLPVCEERQKRWMAEPEGKKCGYFELAVCSKYGRDHWLFVEVKETASLKELDSFLRDIWLECCGHLSAFEIKGTRYEVETGYDYWGEPPRSMNHKLKSVLAKGMTIDYKYDFGSTTELMITAVNYRVLVDRKEKIVILSRNDPIEYLCDVCGKAPARLICSQCLWEGEGYLCEKCAGTHECGEEMLLPVCNSPRMGVCAYEGSDRYPDQFVSDAQLPRILPAGKKTKDVMTSTGK